jgi:ABC-type antimicrobial peptide transport system permease subunit
MILRSKMVKALCAAMVLLLMWPLPLSAYVPSQQVQVIDIEPFWENVAVIDSFLQFDSSGRGTLGGNVVGNAGTTSITVNAVLVRVNADGTTTHITAWNNLTTNERVWIWGTTHFVTRGHNYRLTLTATVVRNGVSETVSSSSTARAD